MLEVCDHLNVYWSKESPLCRVDVVTMSADPRTKYVYGQFPTTVSPITVYYNLCSFVGTRIISTSDGMLPSKELTEGVPMVLVVNCSLIVI